MKIVVLNDAGKHSSNRNQITAKDNQNFNKKNPAVNDGERVVSQSEIVESVIVMQINLFYVIGLIRL